MKYVINTLTLVLLIAIVGFWIYQYSTEQKDEETTAETTVEMTEEATKTVMQETEKSNDGAISLYSFLTDANHTFPPVTTDENGNALGTTFDGQFIPDADTQYIDQTLTVKLYKKDECVCFFYTYNPETKVERLLLLLSAEYYPLLIIAETSFGGIAEFSRVISKEEAFSMKVLALTNVSYPRMQYALNATKDTFGDLTDRSEVVDPKNPQKGSAAVEQYVGRVGKNSLSEKGYRIIGNIQDEMSEDLKTAYGVFQKLIADYALGVYVSVEYTE